jgi:hypothetical protein
MQLKRQLQTTQKQMKQLADACRAKKAITPEEAYPIAVAAMHIAQHAAAIVGASREVSFGKPGSKARIVRKVRAALGFMDP